MDPPRGYSGSATRAPASPAGGREDDENATIPLPVRPLTEKVGIYLNRFRVKHGMTEYRSPQTPDTLPLGV